MKDKKEINEAIEILENIIKKCKLTPSSDISGPILIIGADIINNLIARITNMENTGIKELPAVQLFRITQKVLQDYIEFIDDNILDSRIEDGYEADSDEEESNDMPRL